MGYQAWHRRGLLVIFAVFAFLIVSGTVLSSLQWIHKPFPGFFLHENLTVGPYSLPHWTGGVSGLQSLDLIIKIDDSPVGGRAELYERARALDIGMWQTAHSFSISPAAPGWSIVSRRTDACQYGSRAAFAIIDARQATPIDTSFQRDI